MGAVLGQMIDNDQLCFVKPPTPQKHRAYLQACETNVAPEEIWHPLGNRTASLDYKIALRRRRAALRAQPETTHLHPSRCPRPGRKKAACDQQTKQHMNPRHPSDPTQSLVM